MKKQAPVIYQRVTIFKWKRHFSRIPATCHRARINLCDTEEDMASLRAKPSLSSALSDSISQTAVYLQYRVLSPDDRQTPSYCEGL